jgi:hypothetical protein
VENTRTAGGADRYGSDKLTGIYNIDNEGADKNNEENYMVRLLNCITGQSYILWQVHYFKKGSGKT